MNDKPERFTHFHGADRDTGAATVFEVINPAYVEWLEARVKSLEAFKASVDEALNTGDGSYRP